MNESNSYILDFAHPPVGSEVLYFHLDDSFWQGVEEQQIIGGDMGLELTITTLPDRMFELQFHYEGVVFVPCDRCLQPLEVPLLFEDEMRVILGAELDDEDDEQIVLNEERPVYDFSWIFYELVLVHLPLQMMHDIEDCDPAMTKYLITELPETESEDSVDESIGAMWQGLDELRDKLAKREEGEVRK